ncbi:MAG TPA: hypothetical protein VGB79_04925 [Allosphingosinicella sp.]|jgi:hypothetical protein
MRRAHHCKVYEEPTPPVDRDPRHAVNLVALVTSEACGGAVQVIDVSRRGFSARSRNAVRIGSDINVILPGIGAAKAQVRWAFCGAFGARFHASLTEDRLGACIEADGGSRRSGNGHSGADRFGIG